MSPDNTVELAEAGPRDAAVAIDATKERSFHHSYTFIEDTISQGTAAAAPRHELKQTDRTIAEIEASCKEEQEKERRYQESRIWERIVKEEEARLSMPQRDEGRRRQEREAEALEEARERERDDDDEEAKSMFASLGNSSLAILVSEAKIRAEEELERQYQEKKIRESIQLKLKARAKIAEDDKELARQERQAELYEEVYARDRDRGGEDVEAKAMFASLYQSFPGSLRYALATTRQVGTSFLMFDRDVPLSVVRGKQERKPAHLMLKPHLDESSPKWPAPGLAALMLSRFLGVAEKIQYPGVIEEPSSFLTGNRKGYVYDTPFLMQFRNVCWEKPRPIWDERMREVPDIDKSHMDT
ncbi:hypothetical protein CBER1_10818 [Cercospora berteroae]|uniref:Eukaryotic translation initiation factor 4G1 eIF4E-binding domain-containing protein n=1 Tax=Cercospora berteroae TaxID=357750 RepID=A0A2S6CM74_9PEZI|nr:hypothetical protein CBER1_10818 [Cercospora berteroae]